MGDHESTHAVRMIPPDENASGAKRWRRALKSRYLAAGITAVVLVVGLLLGGRFGIGGRLLPGIGLFAAMIGGHLFMHGGHSGHGRGSRAASASGGADDSDRPYKPRNHSGCH